MPHGFLENTGYVCTPPGRKGLMSFVPAKVIPGFINYLAQLGRDESAGKYDRYLTEVVVPRDELARELKWQYVGREEP